MIIANIDILLEVRKMARKKLETLTEQMFYVLLALRQERHGYGIMQAITAPMFTRPSVRAVMACIMP